MARRIRICPDIEKAKQPAVKDDTKQVSLSEKELKEKLNPKPLSDILFGFTSLVNFQRGTRDELGVEKVDDLTHGKNGSQQFADMVASVKKLAARQAYLSKP